MVAIKRPPALWFPQEANPHFSSETPFEVFHVPTHYRPELMDPSDEPYKPGWYYWFRMGDDLPISEPVGPFKHRDEAEAAAKAAL